MLRPPSNCDESCEAASQGKKMLSVVGTNGTSISRDQPVGTLAIGHAGVLLDFVDHKIVECGMCSHHTGVGTETQRFH